MGNAIKERREELRMSQVELSKRSGISRQTISSIESGKNQNVLVGTLAALASALDTTVDNFLYPERPKDWTGKIIPDPLDYNP